MIVRIERESLVAWLAAMFRAGQERGMEHGNKLFRIGMGAAKARKAAEPNETPNPVAMSFADEGALAEADAQVARMQGALTAE
jgi:hypothetical protein